MIQLGIVFISNIADKSNIAYVEVKQWLFINLKIIANFITFSSYSTVFLVSLEFDNGNACLEFFPLCYEITTFFSFLSLNVLFVLAFRCNFLIYVTVIFFALIIIIICCCFFLSPKFAWSFHPRDTHVKKKFEKHECTPFIFIFMKIW